MKDFLLALAKPLSIFYGLAPFVLRRFLLKGILVLESRIGPPYEALKRLFSLLDDLELIINERATAHGQGVHPKHRLTRYHDYFVKNIQPYSRVLDLGCGIGEVSLSLALRVEGAQVTGVDLDSGRLAQAEANSLFNLRFLLADIQTNLPQEEFDVVVLSNVLEHLDDRVGLLQKIAKQARPKVLLLRIPLFERHWHLPLRKELGIYFFSDPTHKIEYSLAEFEDEVTRGGWRIAQLQTLWGEIWARLEPNETSQYL